MFLLGFVACATPASGTYTLTSGPPETDCAPEDTPTALSAGLVQLRLFDDRDAVTVRPLDDRCPLDHGVFICALPDHDARADYNGIGLDAVVSVDVGISGSGSIAGLAGDAWYVGACEGEDCPELAGQEPAICAT